MARLAALLRQGANGLALTEAIMAGDVSDAMYRALKKQFKSSEIVELVLTASFYAMVPRVLNALRVPIEKDTLHAPVGAGH